MQMSFLEMAAQLNLPTIALIADGAAPELSAQGLMDQERTMFPPFVYENPIYGLCLSAPVFKTGPLVSAADPPHGRKMA